MRRNAVTVAAFLAALACAPAAQAQAPSTSSGRAYPTKAIRMIMPFATGGGMVEKAVAALIEEKKALEKELARMRSKLASGQGTDLASQAVEVKGSRVLAAVVDGADAKSLREAMDKLKDRLKSAAIVLGAVSDGKVALIAGVTPDLTAKVKAGELVNHVAQQIGGKGGGRADMAQAGGTDAAKLPAALESVRAWVEQRL